MKIRAVTLCLMLFTATAACAQDDVDYNFEIGVTAGTSFYNGDLNHKFFGQPGFAGGITGRWLINPYMAVKGTLGYNGIKGSTDNVNDYFPPNPDSPATSTEKRKYNLNDGIIDLNVTYEYNFWPYGLHHGYQGRQRITPYAQIGIGGAYGKAGKAFTFQVPVGVGVKYKLKPRLNIGLDFLYHFTLSDGLDGFKNPLAISSSGFKNKDHYHAAVHNLRVLSQMRGMQQRLIPHQRHNIK